MSDKELDALRAENERAPREPSELTRDKLCELHSRRFTAGCGVAMTTEGWREAFQRVDTVAADAIQFASELANRPAPPAAPSPAGQRYHEIRCGDDGKPDDIVLQCDTVHLERCDDAVWFVAVYRGGKRTALFLSNIGRAIVVNVTENELEAPEVSRRASRAGGTTP